MPHKRKRKWDRVKELGGKVKFESRAKLMSRDPSRAKYVAFVSVFGHDSAGDGNTKEEAVERALQDFPAHLQKHFS
jgi:hypothetical protein